MTVAGIDSNIVIIVTALTTPNAALIRDRISALSLLVASTITITESLVLPFRDKDSNDLDAIWEFFASPHVRIEPVSVAIAEHAARLRARFNLQLADSIHLVTALESGASSFLTTDKHFERCVGELPIDIIRTDP